MDRRIVDLSEGPAALKIKYGQLVIRRGDKEDSLPLDELGVLIVSNPAVCYTQAVLAGICENNGAFIICDEKRHPSAMMMPLSGHFLHTERLAAQISISKPTQKRLWAKIVGAKVRGQAGLLKLLHGNDFGLLQLARNIRSGDTGNIEAQASRRYWPALFGDTFRRIPGSDDGINRMLNYGYAIVRATVARAVTASGLHPSLGLHHHNRYNPFCLVDDLMEPLRPLTDLAVYKAVDIGGPDMPLDKETKQILLENIFARRINIQGEARELFNAASAAASSLANIYTGKGKILILPELWNGK